MTAVKGGADLQVDVAVKVHPDVNDYDHVNQPRRHDPVALREAREPLVTPCDPSPVRRGLAMLDSREAKQ